MKALILNSGMGSRLGILTKNHPKCLLEINNETILRRQLRLLKKYGIKEFVITTGPFAELVKAAAAEEPDINVTFIQNDEYKSSNYIVSIYKAGHELCDDIILLHGDLVFDEKILDVLLNAKQSACLFNEKIPLPDKDFKCRLYSDGRLKEVSVKINDKDCFAFQPMYKLTEKDMQIWFDEIVSFVDNGNKNVYAEEALNNVSGKMNIKGLSYADIFITEIDTEDDYENCIRELQKGIG